jgi:hypothetical protein
LGEGVLVVVVDGAIPMGDPVHEVDLVDGGRAGFLAGAIEQVLEVGHHAGGVAHDLAQQLVAGGAANAV